MTTHSRTEELYDVLGVSRSASPGTIRRAYRQKALITHPDKGGCADTFRLVVFAFETLGSHTEREKYDRAATSIPSKERSPKKPRPQPKDAREGEASQPPAEAAPTEESGQKRHKPIPEDIFCKALNALRGALASASDKQLRCKMIASLTGRLKRALLEFIESQPQVSLSLGNVDQQIGQSSTSHADKGGPTRLGKQDRRKKARTRSDSDSESSSDGLQEADVETGTPFRQSEALALPWGSIEREEGEEQTCARYGCQHALQDVHTQQQEAAGTSQKRRGRRSRFGFRGIGCWQEGNRQVYRAKVSLHGVWIEGRSRHDLESAVSDHVVFVQLRDAVLQVFHRREISILEAYDQLPEVAADCTTEIQRVLQENGADENRHYYRLYGRLSLYKFIGKLFTTPHTRSFSDCLGHLCLLRKARICSWSAVRDAVAQLVQNSRRIDRCRNPRKILDSLDAAYERHNERRVARQSRLEELRRAAGEQRKCKHFRREERKLKRFARLAHRAQSALDAVERSRRRDAQVKAKLERKHARKRRQEWLRTARVLLRKRSDWLRRKDLTFEEVLRGPPV